MNKKRILQLALQIEFDNRKWTRNAKKCTEFYTTAKRMAGEQEVNDYFGFSREIGHDLFRENPRKLHIINTAFRVHFESAELICMVLRHLAETGEVDWYINWNQPTLNSAEEWIDHHSRGPQIDFDDEKYNACRFFWEDDHEPVSTPVVETSPKLEQASLF